MRCYRLRARSAFLCWRRPENVSAIRDRIIAVPTVRQSIRTPRSSSGPGSTIAPTDLALRVPYELDMRPVVPRRSKLVLGNGSQRDGFAEIEVEDRPETVRLGDQTVGAKAYIDVDAPRLNEAPDDDDSVRSFKSDAADLQGR